VVGETDSVFLNAPYPGAGVFGCIQPYVVLPVWRSSIVTVYVVV